MILSKAKYSKIIPVLFVLIAIPFLICSVSSNSIKLTTLTLGAKEKFIKDDPTYVIFIESADVTINHNKKGFRQAM